MLTMELLGMSPRPKRDRPSNEFAIPDCLIGLEYEYEGVNVDWESKFGRELKKYFTTHDDGSLRRNGVEFVLANPLFGENLLDAISAMDEAARAWRFNSSYRTSMHVHIDMTGSQFPQAPVSFGCLYSIVEPLLYRFVGNKREFNNYCLPWHQSEQHFELFLDKVCPKSRLEQRPGMMAEHLRSYKVYKYAGTNFFSLGDFGTIEFRQAPVGMPKAKIIQWINLIMCIKKFVSKKKVPAPTDLMNTAYREGAEKFLKGVFEDHYVNAVRYSPNEEQDFNLGLKTGAQYLVSCSQREIE